MHVYKRKINRDWKRITRLLHGSLSAKLLYCQFLLAACLAYIKHVALNEENLHELRLHTTVYSLSWTLPA